MANSQPNSGDRPWQRRWTKEEVEFLKANYPQIGRRKCAEILGRRESQVRQKTSDLKLRIDTTSEFYREFQSRAAKSKVGKKRPAQADVMRRTHQEGKFAFTPERRKQLGERTKRMWEVSGHPRGALGMTHSKETRDKISKSSKALWDSLPSDERRRRIKRLHQGGGPPKIARGSWKAGWRDIADRRLFFRSRWEANYARYLQHLKASGAIQEWEHEARRFSFPTDLFGDFSYLPDFRVITPSGAVEYHEVKGWMDDRSKASMAAMRTHYPLETLVVIDGKRYRKLEKSIGCTLEGWESRRSG